MGQEGYRKGELLFDDTIRVPNEFGASVYMSTYLDQDVLIINFDETDYTCEKNSTEWGNMYGGFSPTGADYSVYPFAVQCNHANATDDIALEAQLSLYVQDYGTHALKIYTAVEEQEEDTQPESKTMTVREYIDKNLLHLNWNILPQIFEENETELTEEIKQYLKKTPSNTNWNVFESLSGESIQTQIVFEGKPYKAESDDGGMGNYVFHDNFVIDMTKTYKLTGEYAVAKLDSDSNPYAEIITINWTGEPNSNSEEEFYLGNLLFAMGDNKFSMFTPEENNYITSLSIYLEPTWIKLEEIL